MTGSWHLTAVDDAAMRISRLARDRGLDVPVGHLNRWKVRDVVAHLGGVHRWATRVVNERSMAGPGFKKSKLDGLELCDWFDAGAQLLVHELRTAGLDEPCPNFNPGSDRTVAWWARRQAHESTVHRWDIERALGCPTAIDERLAIDGIDEFLDVFVRTRGNQTLESTLVLRTTQTKQAWTLTPAKKPARVDVAAGPPGPLSSEAVTEVSGKPEAMLLALWGRCSATEAGLNVDGEASVAQSLMSI